MWGVVLFVAFLQCFADEELHCVGDCQQGDPNAKMTQTMREKLEFWTECAEVGECPNTKVSSLSDIKCVDGKAGEYECRNVDLLSFISIKDLGAGGDGNDVWGWTDPVTKHDIAMAGMYDGTSFVDVTDPTNPSVLGYLRTHSAKGTFWRDIKVFQNHAFIGSEAVNHGLQVFDLTTLRNLPRYPLFVNGTRSTRVQDIPQLKETAWYGEFGSSHNIVINEDSGFLYAVGSKTCRAGLHIVDIRDPINPKFAGCFADDGYVHDAQCINYKGPDPAFIGQEICFCYDEDTLTIVDVTTKSRPVQLSRVGYQGYAYTHQGWLLPGDEYLLMDDELDELYTIPSQRTRTMLWNVKSLRFPELVNSMYSVKTVIDHNLYTLGDRAYESNYCGGLRILDTSKALNGGELSEVAYFDVSPDCDTPEFLGSWSSYIYFTSGTILVNSIDRGLFVVKYNRE